MQRRLTAILAADVAGYGSLMEADETGTLNCLKAARAQIFDPHVAAHGGRIFKLMGDGVLVEFSSAVAAVACALEIQTAMAAAEPDLSNKERLRYRIGVNLGDVIVEGGDIYGEGVNVAARLQAFAPIGGVTFSKTVRDHVRGRVPYEFDDLGEHTIKRNEMPVHIFSARPAGGSDAGAQGVARSLGLSICVLPFANMSGDAEQEYFSDGISEDIITDLSKVSALLVTARNTAFTFKGKNVDVAQVARQLRVSHVLEGSVRKSGGRVRITAQLIDAVTGGHTWAERYDRDLNDIFALQDEISQAIVAALKLRLWPEEKKAIERRGTNDPEAYKLYLMARQYEVAGNVGSARRSEAIIRLCRRATELDPHYARAWAMIAGAQVTLRFHHGRMDADGMAAAERALALDGTLAEAHAVKAKVLTQAARYEEAERAIEKALRLDSECYEANVAAGNWNLLMRRLSIAISYYEKAAALMETDFRSPGMAISAYLALGDRAGARGAGQRAVERAQKIVESEPDNGSAMSFIIGGLGAMGEVERVKEWIDRAMLLDPDNINMRYNCACTLVDLGEHEAALDLLETVFESAVRERLNWYANDPDIDPIRAHSRYQAMLTRAEGRVAPTKA